MEDAPSPFRPYTHTRTHTHTDDRKPPVLPSAELFSLAWLVWRYIRWSVKGTVLAMDLSTVHPWLDDLWSLTHQWEGPYTKWSVVPTFLWLVDCKAALCTFPYTVNIHELRMGVCSHPLIPLWTYHEGIILLCHNSSLGILTNSFIWHSQDIQATIIWIWLLSVAKSILCYLLILM